MYIVMVVWTDRVSTVYFCLTINLDIYCIVYFIINQNYERNKQAISTKPLEVTKKLTYFISFKYQFEYNNLPPSFEINN